MVAVNKTVLVVEDDEIARTILQMRLEDIGCAVVDVVSCSEAIEACKSGQFDMVLLDLQLHDSSGYDLAEQIRALSGKYSSIPLWAISGTVDKHSHKLCHKVGIDELLSKPVCDSTFEAIKKRIFEAGIEAEDDSVLHKEQAVDVNSTLKANNSHAIDFTKLLRELDGNEAGALGIIELLVKHLPQMVQNIEEYVVHEDMKLVAAESHKLKGSAANVAADGLFKAALAMEMSAKCGRIDRTSEYLRNIKLCAEDTIESAREIISEYQQKRSA